MEEDDWGPSILKMYVIHMIFNQQFKKNYKLVQVKAHPPVTMRSPGKIGVAFNFVSKVLGVTQKNSEHAKIDKNTLISYVKSHFGSSSVSPDWLGVLIMISTWLVQTSNIILFSSSLANRRSIGLIIFSEMVSQKNRFF